MKCPRMYCKPDETYNVARRRWLRRYSEYRDAVASAFLMAYQSGTPKQRHFNRAFYGVELRYITEVI